MERCLEKNHKYDSKLIIKAVISITTNPPNYKNSN